MAAQLHVAKYISSKRGKPFLIDQNSAMNIDSNLKQESLNNGTVGGGTLLSALQGLLQ